MYNSKSATVSKPLFFVSCSLALILLLALVWCLAKLNKKPAESVLDKVAADPATTFIAAINADATVKVFLRDGLLAEPCGSVDSKAKVEGNCNIKGELRHISNVTVFMTESSPGCTGVYNSSGYLLYWKCT
ncbi:MAG: hypothetical protein ACREXW_12145 [Gammaproteobacteria bacterium]